MLYFLTSLFILFSAQGISVESYSLCDKYGVPLDIKFINKIIQDSKNDPSLNVQNGVFVEVGAHDGIMQSNTMLLEKSYGWSGILIEPSESLQPKLLLNRPHSKCFCCALGNFEENNTYVYGDFDGSSMSSVSGERLNKEANTRVLMRSLQSILDEENVSYINLLSLDVEGYEYNVLNGIDYDRTTIDFMIIELYAIDYDLIVSFLSGKGYDLVENFSLYDNSIPGWDGTHNDYLFKRSNI